MSNFEIPSESVDNQSARFTRVETEDADGSVVTIGQSTGGFETIYAVGLVGSIGSLLSFFDSADSR